MWIYIYTQLGPLSSYTAAAFILKGSSWAPFCGGWKWRDGCFVSHWHKSIVNAFFLITDHLLHICIHWCTPTQVSTQQLLCYVLPPTGSTVSCIDKMCSAITLASLNQVPLWVKWPNRQIDFSFPWRQSLSGGGDGTTSNNIRHDGSAEVLNSPSISCTIYPDH